MLGSDYRKPNPAHGKCCRELSVGKDGYVSVRRVEGQDQVVGTVRDFVGSFPTRSAISIDRPSSPVPVNLRRGPALGFP